MSCSLCHNRRPGELIWIDTEAKCIQCGCLIGPATNFSQQEKGDILMSCSACYGLAPGKLIPVTLEGNCNNCGEQITKRWVSPAMKNSTQERRPMMHEFPWHTLAYINELVAKLDKADDKIKLANTISLHSEILVAKVSAWALELRLGDLHEKI